MQAVQNAMLMPHTRACYGMGHQSMSSVKAGADTENPPECLQGWFTFYVHSKPGAPDFPEGSIFSGRTIEERVQASYPMYYLMISCSRMHFLRKGGFTGTFT